MNIITRVINLKYHKKQAWNVEYQICKYNSTVFLNCW